MISSALRNITYHLLRWLAGSRKKSTRNPAHCFHRRELPSAEGPDQLLQSRLLHPRRETTPVSQPWDIAHWQQFPPPSLMTLAIHAHTSRQAGLHWLGDCVTVVGSCRSPTWPRDAASTEIRRVCGISLLARIAALCFRRLINWMQD